MYTATFVVNPKCFERLGVFCSYLPTQAARLIVVKGSRVVADFTLPQSALVNPRPHVRGFGIELVGGISLPPVASFAIKRGTVSHRQVKQLRAWLLAYARHWGDDPALYIHKG